MFDDILEDDYSNSTETDGNQRHHRQHTVRTSPTQHFSQSSSGMKFHASITKNKNLCTKKKQSVKANQLEEHSINSHQKEQDIENSEGIRSDKSLQDGKLSLQAAKKTLRFREHPADDRHASKKCMKINDNVVTPNHDTPNKRRSMGTPLKEKSDLNLKHQSGHTSKLSRSKAESPSKTKSTLHEGKSSLFGGNQIALKHKNVVDKPHGEKLADKPPKTLEKINVKKEKAFGPAKFKTVSKPELVKAPILGPTSKQNCVKQNLKIAPLCSDKKALNRKR